jgi:hypothetical protein
MQRAPNFVAAISGNVNRACAQRTYLPVATSSRTSRMVSEFALITSASPPREKGGTPLILKSTQTRGPCANTCEL